MTNHDTVKDIIRNRLESDWWDRYNPPITITPDDLTPTREWADEGDPDDWPPPAEHVEGVITGDLAARIRRRLSITDPDTPVTYRERITEDGYSEYTCEVYNEITFTCGDRERHFDDDGRQLLALMAWLDEDPDAPSRRVAPE